MAAGIIRITTPAGGTVINDAQSGLLTHVHPKQSGSVAFDELDRYSVESAKLFQASGKQADRQ